jgi:hypothetical protein
MSPTDAPLTLDRILTAAVDFIRRFGPDKATVVDVARALGVSHTAVAEWADPNIDAAYADVWQLLMDGLQA